MLLRTRITYSVASTVGYGRSKTAIISSLSLAIIILFYSLSVASYFSPDVYRFEDRTTFHQYFQDRYIFDKTVDSTIISLSLLVWIYFSFRERLNWMMLLFLGTLVLIGFIDISSLINRTISISSLPFILCAHVINTRNKILKASPRIDATSLTLNYFLILFMVLALISIYFSMTKNDHNNPFIDIMVFLSRYTPILMILLIFSPLVRLILKQAMSPLPSRISTAIVSLIDSLEVRKFNSNNSMKIILLSCFMLISIFIVLLPHLDGQLRRVAEDTTLYEDWIDPMKHSRDIYQLIELAFVKITAASTGDRPLTLLILHGLSSIAEIVYAFEIILPSILAPSLVLIIYFLTKEITRNDVVSLFASFITAVSFQVTIGIYAGFYATWIALIFGYLSLLFAIRYLNTKDKKNLVWLPISLIALLFSHVYTWTILTGFLILFLLVLKWKGFYEGNSIKIVLIIVIGVFFVDLLRSYLVGLASGLERNALIAESFNFGLSQLGASWSNIVRTVEVHLGGIFGNVVILSLALYCTVRLKYKTVPGIFVIVFLSLGILPVLFGDKIVQSRVIYDIPFQIPAAMALTYIFNSRTGKLITITIALSLLSIAVYTMTNLGVSPR